MAFGKEKTFATITAPLSGMVEKLEVYVDKQKENEAGLEQQKKDIDDMIVISKDEQAKSVVTAKNLKIFMDPTRVLVTEEAAAEQIAVEDEAVPEKE